MRLINIRDRMLLAAILPVTLVAILLTAVHLIGLVNDFDEDHKQRAKSLTRQIATASEFGLFSGNTRSLQSIAMGAMREVDVNSVVILDSQGQIMARAGELAYSIPLHLAAMESNWLESRTGNDVWVQPVLVTQIKLDDLFDNGGSSVRDQSNLLGHVLIEMSRKTLVAHERDMLLIGLVTSLMGMLFGGYLAMRIGRGVINPILRVSDMIERIGKGELSARGKILLNDPLRDLQIVLNQMASRLEQGRDELERRIKVATLELREKKEEAETATQAKSLFLAAASHDLRQPIHALGMFVARLAQLPHDEQTHSLITNLEASVRAMQDLLDALLDISKLDSQAVKVSTQAFPIENILAQLRMNLVPLAQEKGLELRVRICDKWVVSDPDLLHRILLNLVSNALAYTNQGGVLVACRSRQEGRQLRIEVWDTGIGIAPEHWDDVYKEFFQIGNVVRDRSKGLGLGLSIVHRIARLLGYRLDLNSLPGKGTRFSIDVPMASVPVALSIPEEPVAILDDDLSDLMVLVIEDDTLVARALTSLMESWGCRVLLADGPVGALSLIKQGHTPQMIVSDYRLRDGENGLETVLRLREVMGHQVPACLMSGDTDPELAHQARLAGLTLLQKPVRLAKLRSLMRRLIQESRR